MIVVSDTSCVTNLLAIGRENLLQQLYGEVIVPEKVWRELNVEHPLLPQFIRHATILNTAAAQLLSVEPMDEGEAEAIILAEEIHADYLLMDEAAGRAIATARGIRVIGLLGVIRRAKERGLVPSMRPIIADLRDKAGFWLSEGLVNRVLREAGEL